MTVGFLMIRKLFVRRSRVPSFFDASQDGYPMRNAPIREYWRVFFTFTEEGTETEYSLPTFERRIA